MPPACYPVPQQPLNMVDQVWVKFINAVNLRGPTELGKRYLDKSLQEVRVGPTYSSNIEDQDVEVTTIPPPIPKPGQAGLDTTGKEFVFFEILLN